MNVYDQIHNYFYLLNKEENLPKYGLRRNSIIYPLFTYINHTIALFLGKSYDGVLLFVNRANKEIDNLKQKNYINSDKSINKYINLCEEYLLLLIEYLNEHHTSQLSL